DVGALSRAGRGGEEPAPAAGRGPRPAAVPRPAADRLPRLRDSLRRDLVDRRRDPHLQGRSAPAGLRTARSTATQIVFENGYQTIGPISISGTKIASIRPTGTSGTVRIIATRK